MKILILNYLQISDSLPNRIMLVNKIAVVAMFKIVAKIVYFAGL